MEEKVDFKGYELHHDNNILSLAKGVRFTTSVIVFIPLFGHMKYYSDCEIILWSGEASANKKKSTTEIEIKFNLLSQ